MDDRAALRTLTRAIKHRFYLLVAIAAGLTLVAGLAAIARQPAYRATALLYVDQRLAIPLQTGQPLSDHFIQTATSPSVLTRACSGVYFDTPDTSTLRCDASTLAPLVSANAVDNAGWIGVNVTADSAVKASSLANAVARALVDQNRADVEQLLAPTRDFLNQEIARLDAEIKQAGATPGANVNLLQSQYLSTYNRLLDLMAQQRQAADSLKIEGPAVPPLHPYDPDPIRYLGVGLLAGLCIGLAAVVLVDRFDDRLLDTEALSSAADTALVFSVRARDSATLTAHASNPFSTARAGLLAVHPDLKTLLVVAASPREKLRPIAAGIGAAAVKAGHKVLVVDAGAPAYVMQQQSGRRGSKMTVVSTPTAGSEMKDTPSGEEASYDLTLTLAPPPDTNPLALSSMRSGAIAIVVATAGVTRYSEVRKTSALLRLAGIVVAAAILAIDAPREAAAGEELPVASPAEPDLLDLAATTQRLPTWRGPGR